MEMCDESRMESHSRGALVQSAYSLRDVPNVELTLRFYETVENVLRHEAVVFFCFFAFSHPDLVRGTGRIYLHVGFENLPPRAHYKIVLSK